MGIRKKLTTGIKIIGIPVVSIGSLLTIGNLYYNHNVSYETQDEKVFKKIDGVFGHTEVRANKNSDEVGVIISHGFNFKSYTDKDGDNYVDRVYLGSNPFKRGSHLSSYNLDRDGLAFPSVFKNANQDFRKQIKRFKPLMNR